MDFKKVDDDITYLSQMLKAEYSLVFVSLVREFYEGLKYVLQKYFFPQKASEAEKDEAQKLHIQKTAEVDKLKVDMETTQKSLAKERETNRGHQVRFVVKYCLP